MSMTSVPAFRLTIVWLSWILTPLAFEAAYRPPLVTVKLLTWKVISWTVRMTLSKAMQPGSSGMV
jgi:hypothetical protein